MTTHLRPNDVSARASDSPHLTADPEPYRMAMRNHAGAVIIVSTGRPGDRTGLTATSVCSLSDSPPRVIACVNRSASAHRLINATRAFAINILGAAQTELATIFAGRHGIDGENRFVEQDWLSLATGAPVLRRALANLDCELIAEHAYETHSIFVGEVKAVRTDQAEHPLIYFGGGFRHLENGSA